MKFWSIILAAFAAFVIGCGGPTREAQVALTATAHALRTVDHELAPRYATAAEEARAHSTDWTSYDAAMRPWDDVERALRVAHTALLATQAGLDAWRSGDERGWITSVRASSRRSIVSGSGSRHWASTCRP